MLKIVHFKSDIKLLLRDPIMAMLLGVPLIIPVIFRLLIIFLLPWLNHRFGLDVTPYFPYILSMVMVMNPGLLGAVMGFMMLDDKDGNIIQLMAVTPSGKTGYILHRMSLVFILSFIYSIYSYWVLNILILNTIHLLYIALITPLFGCVVGLILFRFATDKVKGLTFAKGINILMIFVFADLWDNIWVQCISMLFPTYWTAQVIMHPSILNMVVCAGIHIMWVAGIFKLSGLVQRDH